MAPNADIGLIGLAVMGQNLVMNMADHGYGAGMQIWRMLYPSLTLQVFIKPILPLLEIVSPAKSTLGCLKKKLAT